MENLTDNITDNITDNNLCCVCLNIIDENEKCLLKCSHFLCSSCIDSWFDQKKTTCPMCREVIKYYKKGSENFRIIHSRRNTQLEEGQSIIDNVYLKRLLWFNRILVFTNSLMIYLLLFYYIPDNQTFDESLKDCIRNNTFVKNMLDNCDGTRIIDINVYNPIKHTLSSCSFPIYFIDKCFND